MARDFTPVVRGARLGVIAALLVGGLSIFAIGALTLIRGPDCAELSPLECAEERQIVLPFARMQVWAGGALALMGLAVFLFTRPRKEAAP